MQDLILAIDQGTTGTTALLVDSARTVRGRGYREFAQIYPRPGEVEHDPEAIWASVVGALAVWLPHSDGVGGEGHVAYVAAVSAEGRILVDDSNWRPTPTSPDLQVHEHWVSAASPSGYIYGGPAGAGPRT